jgi:hypothetical protein
MTLIASRIRNETASRRPDSQSCELYGSKTAATIAASDASRSGAMRLLWYCPTRAEAAPASPEAKYKIR